MTGQQSMATTSVPLPAPTFPFSITDVGQYRDALAGLQEASKSGDLSQLELFEKKFRGIPYEDCYALHALESGHIEFFKRYTMLSRMTLIADFNYERPWFWRYYLQPLLHALRAKTSDEIRLEAVQFYFEELLPRLPSKDEVVRARLVYRGMLIKLPAHEHTIWNIADLQAFTNQRDRDACRRHAVNRDSSLPILEYLSRRINLQYKLLSLHIFVISFSRSLYNFVLDHLDPSLDKSQLPSSCQFVHHPTDADFVHILFSASDQSPFRQSDWMVFEFLQNFPEFRSKIPSIIEWIRACQAAGPSSQLPDNMRFVGDAVLKLFYSISFPILEFVERIASLLGPIDHAEPIQFDSKRLEDRIPRFPVGKPDHEIMADERNRRDVEESGPIQEQNSSINEQLENLSVEDEIHNDDNDVYSDGLDDADNYDYYDEDGDDGDYNDEEDDDDYSDEDLLDDPYTRAQNAYHEEDDSLYPEL